MGKSAGQCPQGLHFLGLEEPPFEVDMIRDILQMDGNAA